MVSLNLYVGKSSSGKRVYESLPVEPLGDSKYKLMASPGLVLGIAKGDEIKYFDENGEFEILCRGGNLCIQVYLSEKAVEEVDNLAAKITLDLNGTLDARTRKQIVFSIPVESGFNTIESVLNSFVDRNIDCEWYYGNVYEAENGEIPLNWWQ